MFGFENIDVLVFNDYEKGDFRWIDIRSFKCNAEINEIAIIGELLDNPWYKDDYFSPTESEPSGDSVIHGPYMLDSISVRSFAAVSEVSAENSLRHWISQDGELPPALSIEIENNILSKIRGDVSIFQLLEEGLTLQGPPIVSRLSGFLEFIIIDKNNRLIELLVASDD